MKIAVYTHRILNETFEVGGVKNIGQAWNLAEHVCNQTNWNFSMFDHDVKVSIKTL